MPEELIHIDKYLGNLVAVRKGDKTVAKLVFHDGSELQMCEFDGTVEQFKEHLEKLGAVCKL